MTELLRVKNTVHGGIAALPESALEHLENWEPVPGPPPAEPKPRRELRRAEAAANAAANAPEPEPNTEADPSDNNEEE